MLAEHKNTIEKNLVKYRLRNELLQHERKELSLFHDDTDDPTFMCKLYFSHQWLIYSF